MKKYLVVTGGAGFVGSSLIEYLILKTDYFIISLDNYFSGNRRNHIKNYRVKYIKGDSKNIIKILKKYTHNIDTIFHFGEFSRIYQSFLQMNKCIESNTIGSHAVFNFCLLNKIRLVYSATSATLGNNGYDKNLSPYSFTKSRNIEFLENLKKWFNFKYDVIFFYNVYGPRQIKRGKMATVIGIFEDYYLNNKPLPVVRPGTQSRRFTHIDDTVKICYTAWKENKGRFYSITNKQSFTILEVAKLFSSKIKLLPQRRGERYKSTLSNDVISKKIHKYYGKISLKKYIKDFKNNNS